jgi:hypothetical protein
VTLIPMGIGEPETFRCRVYDGTPDDTRQRSFLEALYTSGVLDCPAYDSAIGALQDRGWVPLEPEYEPAPGGGRYARWRLTEVGRRGWEAVR